MPEIVKCPGCNCSLRVPEELLGKPVHCPSCQVTFMAQAGSAEPPAPPMAKMEIEQDDEPLSWYDAAMEEIKADDRRRPAVSRKPMRRANEDGSTGTEEDYGDDDEMEEVAERRGRRSPRGSHAEWQRVRSGFGYFLAAAYTFVGLILVLFAAEGARGAGDVIFMVICLGGLLTAIVLQLIGQIFSLAAPEYRAARTLAKIGLGLFVTLLLALVAMAGVPPMGMGAAVVKIIGWLPLLAFAGVLIFMIRSLASALREAGLARNAIYLFIYFLVCFVFLILGVVLVELAVAKLFRDVAAGQGAGNRMPGLRVALLVMFFDMLLFLGFLIWYIITLSKTRGAITRATRRH